MRTIIIFASLLLTAIASAAEPRVSLELATEKGLPITAQQKLAKSVQSLGVGGVRIREANEKEKPSVTDLGGGNSFQVLAIVTRDGKIAVPGKQFSSSDLGPFKTWLGQLAESQSTKPKEEIVAFGLSPEQLVATHGSLATKVAFATRDKSCFDNAKAIVGKITLTVSMDADAREALEAHKDVFPDELQGISVGTALAATLRPAGLVFTPVRSGDEVRLRIAKSKAVPESWPIGWPKTNGIQKTLPVMYKSLNVAIAAETPLATALSSIQERVEAPFLYDHNSLARRDLDLKKLTCSHPEQKTHYKNVIDRLLSKQRMQCEIRVDEAESPFVWISARP